MILPVLALLVATPAPEVRTTELSSSLGVEPFTVEADRLFADPEVGLFVAEGHTALRRGRLVVFADRLTFDRKKDTVTAEGEVVLVEGTALMRCERITLQLPGLSGVIDQADIRVKRGVDAATLAALPRESVLGRGRDRLRLTADRLERTGERELSLDGASFYPCPCQDDLLTWRIAATSAEVDVDEGAWLVAPVFYVREVPVFFVPVLYVPLGERRSGLLFPRFKHSSVAGYAVTEPIYFTLGRSWDATLEAGYLTRRGFSPGLELRWAPSAESAGRLHALLLLDRGALTGETWHQDRPAILPRFALGAEHRTRIGEDQSVAIDLSFTGDPAYLSEFGAELLERQEEESLSRATYRAWYARGIRVAIGAAFREDLRPGRYPLDAADPEHDELRELSIFDDRFPGSGAVRQRFLELRLDAEPSPLLRRYPALLGGARFSAQGFAAPSAELSRFARVDFRPAIEWALSIGDAVSISPELALRFTGWSGASAGSAETAGRIAVVARTVAFTDLWRRYGTWAHRLRPEVAHAIVPYVGGDGPGPFATGDEIDQLGRAHQLRARLISDLWRDGRRMVGVRAGVGHDFGLSDVPGEGTSELLAGGDLDLPGLDGVLRARLTLDLALRLDPARLTSVVANLDVSLGGWLAVSGSFGRFDRDLSIATFIAPEELVPSATVDRRGYVPAVVDPLLELPWSPFSGFTAGATVRPIPPFFLRAGAGVDLDGTAADPLRYVTTSLGWESPCECWQASVGVGFARDRTGPDISVLFDLSQLGSGGS